VGWYVFTVLSLAERRRQGSFLCFDSLNSRFSTSDSIRREFAFPNIPVDIFCGWFLRVQLALVIFIVSLESQVELLDLRRLGWSQHVAVFSKSFYSKTTSRRSTKTHAQAQVQVQVQGTSQATGTGTVKAHINIDVEAHIEPSPASRTL
jgi:hypothetical protein